MKRASASVPISLGVVPEAISAWKPETAPQAMVMKRKGKSAPDQTGPVPSTKWVSAGLSSLGATKIMPIANPSVLTATEDSRARGGMRVWADAKWGGDPAQAGRADPA